MDTPRLLRQGTPCVANILAGTELVIVVDFSHEPWKTLASVMLQQFNGELAELGYTIENFDILLSVIEAVHGELQ